MANNFASKGLGQRWERTARPKNRPAAGVDWEDSSLLARFVPSLAATPAVYLSLRAHGSRCTIARRLSVTILTHDNGGVIVF